METIIKKSIKQMLESFLPKLRKKNHTNTGEFPVQTFFFSMIGLELVFISEQRDCEKKKHFLKLFYFTFP